MACEIFLKHLAKPFEQPDAPDCRHTVGKTDMLGPWKLGKIVTVHRRDEEENGRLGEDGVIHPVCMTRPLTSAVSLTQLTIRQRGAAAP